MTGFARVVAVVCVLACMPPIAAQRDGPIPKAPPRRPGEGRGPFETLILRGGILVDGTGAPARGPVDIVIEKNRIDRIVSVGAPGLPIEPGRRPKAGPSTEEIDCSGRYILPGFIDMHAHIGGKPQGVDAEYVFKLWMAHGITSIREAGSGNGLDWVLDEKRQSDAGKITAPRIHPYVVFGQGHKGPFTNTRDVLQWLESVKKKGAMGIKFFGYRPDLFRYAIETAKRLGLKSACHHAQLDVTRSNVLQTARWGLTTMEHWYGLPEALFEDRRIQNYPPNYNYNNEQDRFAEAGRLWKQAAAPFSDHWNDVMNELLALDFTLDPTFTIYEASRDLMRVRRAEWHDEYTMPKLWDYFRPTRDAHGSYWFHWSTADEVAWKENYRLWMTFVNEYKNRGGRVTTGSDSGFIYKLYGFGYIRELELLQEAGFHPLEVIRSATLMGAEALGRDHEIGSIEPGKLADIVVVPANPLANLKVLYGTGAVALNDKNQPIRVGGIEWTIKDGIVFDARRLLADVRAKVRAAKQEEGRELVQPGR